jgi:hemolysin-activating ACP:hemolysin acyltransferase
MPASKMLDDLKTILSLYRKFDRYKKYTDKELLFHILPSYELNQYKIHTQGDEVIAFTNWAFLNKDAEKQLILTGKINPNDWKSGNNVWHIDIICVKNIKKVMSWIKQYYTNLLGTNRSVNWLRVSDDGKVYKVTKTLTKRHYK